MVPVSYANAGAIEESPAAIMAKVNVTTLKPRPEQPASGATWIAGSTFNVSLVGPLGRP